MLITMGFESFSDEHIENQNLSFNDFVKLLESESDEGLVIENCNIIYNKHSDYKYLQKETAYNFFMWRRFIINDLNVDKSVSIINSKFLEKIDKIQDGLNLGDGIHFKNCHFKNFTIYNDHFESSNSFEFTNSVIDEFFKIKNANDIEFDSLFIKGPISFMNTDDDLNKSFGEIDVKNSNISSIHAINVNRVYINNSKISYFARFSNH